MGFVNWKKDKGSETVRPTSSTAPAPEGNESRGGMKSILAMMGKFMPSQQKKKFWDAMKAEGITLLMEPDEIDSKFSCYIRKPNEAGEFEVLHKFTI
jgi:hypothetical protein